MSLSFFPHTTRMWGRKINENSDAKCPCKVCNYNREEKCTIGKYACTMYFAGSKERTKAIKEMKQNIEGCNLEM